MYKNFPFHWYKKNQVLFLAASPKDSISGTQKNSIKCYALFPQQNLKTSKFYGVSNTEEQFDFPRKLISVAHCFLEKPLVAASDYYHNHLLISKICYQLPMNFQRKVHCAIVLIQKKSAFSYLFLPTFFVFHFFWEAKIMCN